MPWAVFFDLDNGIAMHEVPPAYRSILGQRASGGCVRLSPAFAQEMFERVEKTRGSTIPKINQDGTPVLDKAGQVVYSNTTVLYDNVKEPAYSALIYRSGREIAPHSCEAGVQAQPDNRGLDLPAWKQ